MSVWNKITSSEVDGKCLLHEKYLTSKHCWDVTGSDGRGKKVVVHEQSTEVQCKTFKGIIKFLKVMIM